VIVGIRGSLNAIAPFLFGGVYSSSNNNENNSKVYFLFLSFTYREREGITKKDRN
jgi:hypothetical protein